MSHNPGPQLGQCRYTCDFSGSYPVTHRLDEALARNDGGLLLLHVLDCVDQLIVRDAHTIHLQIENTVLMMLSCKHKGMGGGGDLTPA